MPVKANIRAVEQHLVLGMCYIRTRIAEVGMLTLNTAVMHRSGKNGYEWDCYSGKSWLCPYSQSRKQQEKAFTQETLQEVDLAVVGSGAQVPPAQGEHLYGLTQGVMDPDGTGTGSWPRYRLQTSAFWLGTWSQCELFPGGSLHPGCRSIVTPPHSPVFWEMGRWVAQLPAAVGTFPSPKAALWDEGVPAPSHCSESVKGEQAETWLPRRGTCILTGGLPVWPHVNNIYSEIVFCCNEMNYSC